MVCQDVRRLGEAAWPWRQGRIERPVARRTCNRDDGDQGEALVGIDGRVTHRDAGAQAALLVAKRGIRVRRGRRCRARVSRATLRPALALDPADGSSRIDIDEPFVGGQVGHPVGQPRVDQRHGVGMRTADGPEQGGLPSPRQFVLDGLGDESTPVALDSVDAVDEVGGKRHGHACGFCHDCTSMTHDMIILNVLLPLRAETARHLPVEQE